MFHKIRANTNILYIRIAFFLFLYDKWIDRIVYTYFMYDFRKIKKELSNEPVPGINPSGFLIDMIDVVNLAIIIGSNIPPIW